MSEKPKLKVNQDACVGCGLCCQNCNAGAITVKAGQYVIDNEVCVLCRYCAEHCMSNAIEVVK